MRLRHFVNALLLAAVAALGAACGDSLVDSGAEDLLALDCQPGTATCLVGAELACVPDTAARCGATCADCTTGTVPGGAVAACVAPAGGGPGVCGFECQGGRLRCGDGCCEATALAAGLAHTCAITSAGSLVCWGSDEWGQITDRVTLAVYPPTVASQGGAPFAAGVTALAAGQLHTCAVVSGVVRCLGWNDFGQAPDAVPGLANVVALAAGQRHTCALTGAGAVTCWGAADRRGGDGGTSLFTPIAAGVARISAGLDHTCAVMQATGEVRCWGLNAAGQLGNGTQVASVAPVAALVTGIAHVAGGHSSTCATPTVPTRTENIEDGVRCWGAAPESSWAPFGFEVPQTTPKIPLKDANSSVIRRLTPQGIAVGRTHVCVLGDDAVTGIRCFGPENASGQLGTSAPPTTEEVSIPNSLGARALAAGEDHTCAIWSDGGVRCWGTNASGQLGDGTATFPGAGVIVTVSGR